MKMDHLAIIFKDQMIFKRTPRTADAEGIHCANKFANKEDLFGIQRKVK